jgi:ABC-type multidrug transport system ATPase subunit
MIETINVTKRYDGRTIVDHVTLRVEKGQIFGFLSLLLSALHDCRSLYF